MYNYKCYNKGIMEHVRFYVYLQIKYTSNRYCTQKKILNIVLAYVLPTKLAVTTKGHTVTTYNHLLMSQNVHRYYSFRILVFYSYLTKCHKLAIKKKNVFFLTVNNRSMTSSFLIFLHDNHKNICATT